MFRRLIHGSLVVALAIVTAADAARAAPPSGGAKSGRKSNPRGTSPENPPRSGNDAAVASKPSGIEPVNPGLFLLRDPLVQQAVGLTGDQKLAAAELAAEFNESIWRFRDANLDLPKVQQEVRQINGLIQPKLEKLLSVPQVERLAGIALQAQGTNSLLYGSTGEKLALTTEQQQKLARINANGQATLKKLREKLGGQSAGARDKLEKAGADLQRELQEVLTDVQKRRWHELAGDKIDVAKLRPLTAQAPDLRGVTDWINSEPLRLEEFRGRVVALHFFTFGCINCIHNYPSYKRWHENFSRRELVLIGIQSPETADEKQLEKIRQSVAEHGLPFPIAVDNNLENWHAWSNTIWPAVYLIDKRGHVRYWWYGELNWQGAEGEKFMAEKIRELNAEK